MFGSVAPHEGATFFVGIEGEMLHILLFFGWLQVIS